ncbi:hypothetical protein FOH38_23290 [Lysinibacillus fusiformis]|nr:hypothetical protein FOH38_23290 [Lysinibacillus fusiformis]
MERSQSGANPAEDALKTIVDMQYWNPSGISEDWLIIVNRLYMSRNKVLRKRNALIDETAKRLAWA